MSDEKSRGYELLASLPRGAKLYTILRHVSKTGMTRWMDVVHVEDNSPEFVYVPELLRESKQWDGYYRVTGTGMMDMGFELIYSLGQLVHNDGYWFKHEWL